MLQHLLSSSQFSQLSLDLWVLYIGPTWTNKFNSDGENWEDERMMRVDIIAFLFKYI